MTETSKYLMTFVSVFDELLIRDNEFVEEKSIETDIAQ